MTARLSRLRIAGFKSFAEPVSLDILPGLTGIVGPNGCGKSNVVEALRWAMGETSARSLRGGEMDDVIFAGTTARASRNLAEVTITLDGDLPAPFEAEAELAVTRRIERGAGSHFRVNGREFRARDVQTLYADLASGARSSGMVSQGRVSQLVNAKPEERRQVLEEAAGITGLHARRHEAELKLRAAEQNLARAEDVRGQLDTAREAMRKQARQTSRYRNISSLIRAAEGDHLAVLLGAAQAALDAAGLARTEAAAAALAAAEEVETARAALDEAEAALPAPREALSLAERSLERRRIEAEGVAAEAERVRLAAAEAEHRLLELQADLEAAERARADTASSVERLRAESEHLARRAACLPGEIVAAREAGDIAGADLEVARQAAEQATAKAQEANLATAQADATRRAAGDRLAKARLQQEAARAELAAAHSRLVPAHRVAAAEQVVAQAGQALADARKAAELAELARADAARELAMMRAETEAADTARNDAERSASEAQARAARLAQAHAAANDALRALIAARVAPQTLIDARDDAQAAGAAAEACERQLETCEQSASQARTEQAAASRRMQDVSARSVQATREVSEAQARLDRLHAELSAAETTLKAAEADAPDPALMARADEDAVAAERLSAEAAEALAGASSGRAAADASLAAAREAADGAQACASRLAGEARGLADAMGTQADDAALLSAIVVPEGLENALGAALGDGDTASLNEATERFWRALPVAAQAPLLPADTTALARLIEAPPALACLLAHTALLEDEADGDELHATLSPGVVLVRRDGACWRWDGQVTRPGAPNAAAVRLAQRRRLAQLLASQEEAAISARSLMDNASAAAAAVSTAIIREAAARGAVTHAEQRAREARAAADRLAAASAMADAKRSSTAPSVLRLRGEVLLAARLLADAEIARDSLGDVAQARAEAAAAEAVVLSTAKALETARLSRQAARAAWAAAQEEVQRLEQRSAEIEARIAGSMPALEELARQQAEAQERLADARATLAATSDAAVMAESLAMATAREASARDNEARSRGARRQAEQELQSARDQAADLRAEGTEAESKAAALAAMLARAEQETAQAAAAAEICVRQAESLPDPVALDAAAAAARSAREKARADWQARLAALESLHASLALAQSNAQLVATDLAAWQARHEEATTRASAMGTRCMAARAAWQSLSTAPDGAAAKAARSGSALAEAEAAHAAAQRSAVQAEQRARALSVALRDGEQRQAACREAAVRAEASHAAAAGAVQAVLMRAAERLGADAVLHRPDDLSDAAEERARRKFERLSRERDEMGPVNLRADLELAELDERAANLDREREELGTAIAKLRGAIGHLNREGRERLTAVFTQVDQHFQTLFTRMMSGGRAHLALTGSDDPLSAGLEIYAEPPGKKLSSLALLSGGEQALTALSLIFAVFRCTPAPISVLDEVDAPLDDANVERFCTLLDDVVRDTGTRFLVVTHHQLTMSRMDRLFGVTMQERGVSRLLSVDLRHASQMVEPVLHAAAE